MREQDEFKTVQSFCCRLIHRNKVSKDSGRRRLRRDIHTCLSGLLSSTVVPLMVVNFDFEGPNREEEDRIGSSGD